MNIYVYTGTIVTILTLFLSMSGNIAFASHEDDIDWLSETVFSSENKIKQTNEDGDNIVKIEQITESNSDIAALRDVYDEDDEDHDHDTKARVTINDDPEIRSKEPLKIRVVSNFGHGDFCLYDTDGDRLKCENIDGPKTIKFVTNEIPIGDSFKVCEELVDFCIHETNSNGGTETIEFG